MPTTPPASSRCGTTTSAPGMFGMGGGGMGMGMGQMAQDQESRLRSERPDAALTFDVPAFDDGGRPHADRASVPAIPRG